MKLKDKIIKLLGGYTAREHVDVLGKAVSINDEFNSYDFMTISADTKYFLCDDASDDKRRRMLESYRDILAKDIAYRIFNGRYITFCESKDPPSSAGLTGITIEASIIVGKPKRRDRP